MGGRLVVSSNVSVSVSSTEKMASKSSGSSATKEATCGPTSEPQVPTIGAEAELEGSDVRAALRRPPVTVTVSSPMVGGDAPAASRTVTMSVPSVCHAPESALPMRAENWNMASMLALLLTATGSGVVSKKMDIVSPAE